MEPDEPTDLREESCDEQQSAADDDLEMQPRSPWLGRGLVAGALGLWGVVAWMRVGGDARVQLRPAALVEDADDDVDGDGDGDADDGDLQDDAEVTPAYAGQDEAVEAAAGSGARPTKGAARALDETPRDPRDRLEGAAWAQDFKVPDKVIYTVKRGGSMKMVANLYKIFHHEIEALNPGVSLERELGPGTKLVV